MTEIMILLVVVVLLILVVGYFAMRFLRADAHDPFEDAPDDHRRPRDADDDWRGNDRVVPLAARSGRGDRGPAQRPGRGGSARGGRPAGRGDRRPGRDYDQDDREYAGGRDYPDDRQSRFDDRDPGGRGGQRLPAGSRGGGGPAVGRPGPEQGRPAGRPAAARGAGGAGTDWDSLSDVDYWAELASDKPLTTTAQPAGPARPERGPADAPPDPRQDVTSRPGRPVNAGPPDESTALLPRRRNGSAGAADSAPLPAVASGRGGSGNGLLEGGNARGRGGRSAAPSQSGSSGQSAHRQRDLSAVPYNDSRGLLASGPGAAGSGAHGSEQGIAALARLSTGGSRPAPLDDDPLTSPSFPAVSGDDSRSYRTTGRSDAPLPGPRASGGYPAPDPLAAAQQASAQQATQQMSSYMSEPTDPLSGYGDRRPGGPASGSHRATGGHRASEPNGYDQSNHGQSNHGQSSRGQSDYGRPGYGQPEYGQSDYSQPGGRQPAYGPPAPAAPAPAPPAAASYRDYAEQPPSAPTGNPYGSYVTPPAESYTPPAAAPSLPDSDAGYGSYLPGQDTRQYSQPTGRHLASAPAPIPAAPAPVDAVPLYAAPTYAAPVHAAPPAEPAPGGYGASWYDTPGAGGYADPAALHQAQQAQARQAQAHQAQAHRDPASGRHGQPSGGSYPAGAYGQPDYPPADYNGRPYGQPADPPANAHDQHGYGTPDSGYGTEAYGGYPGY